MLLMTSMLLKIRHSKMMMMKQKFKEPKRLSKKSKIMRKKKLSRRKVNRMKNLKNPKRWLLWKELTMKTKKMT